MSRMIWFMLLSLATSVVALAQPRTTFGPREDGQVVVKTGGRHGPRRALDRLPYQRTCHTMEVDSLLRLRWPALGSLAAFEAELADAISRRSGVSLQSEQIVTIPVIVHVVHNGEPVGVGTNLTASQVESQIAVLNEDYRMTPGTPGHNDHPAGADTRVQFALARVDPDGRPLAEPGVHRVQANVPAWNRDLIEEQLKPQTQWDPTRYLNLWTLAFDESAPLLGYAQFPNLSQLDGLDPNMGPANTDGVVINYRAFGREGSAGAPYDGGRTASHEIGHWLGLRHIWGDGDCTKDDYCDDTPTAGKPNYVCDYDLNSCEGGDRDMVENYMDYTNDGCMNLFTMNQAQRIRAVLARSPRRKELLESTVHLPPTPGGGAPVAAFRVDRRNVCQGGQVSFFDESTNSPTSWNWLFFFDGEFVGSSDDRNPVLTFDGTGQWDVMLVVSNAQGTDTVARRNFITAVPGGELNLPMLVTFEEGQRLPGWTVLNPDDDRSWALSETIGAGGSTTSARLDNYSMETDPSGTVDVLVSPRLALDAGTVPEITFNVAYATYEDEDGLYGDTLALLYSTDCGGSWTPFWYKGGNALATAPTTDEYYEPAPNEWRRERVSLEFLTGQSDVQIAILNASGWGNVLYIDDIEITAEFATQAPSAAFSADRRDICGGNRVTFTDESTGHPSSWQWTFEGGTPPTSNLQHPRVEYERPGTYSVTLRALNAVGSDISSVNGYITVGAPAQISAHATRTRIRRGESTILSASGAEFFFWSNGRDNELVAGESVTVTPIATTTYSVIGLNSGECPGYASVTVTVDEGTSGNGAEELPANVLTLAPNPADDELALDLRSEEIGDVAVSIVDISGSIVLNLDETKTGLNLRRSLDISGLPAGAYIVRVTTHKGTVMGRFVKR